MQIKFKEHRLDIDYGKGKVVVVRNSTWTKKDKNYFASLVKTKAFQDRVKNIRKELGLENKLLTLSSYEDLIKKRKPSEEITYQRVADMIAGKETKIDAEEEIRYLISHYSYEIVRKKKLSFRWRRTIGLFILTGYGFPPEEKIYIKGGTHEVSITVAAPISKPSFLKYIDDNWPKLTSFFKKFPESKLPTLTERDFFIIELRKINTPYKKICNQVVSEFSIDNSDGHINEDSIKTAYHSALKKYSKF